MDIFQVQNSQQICLRAWPKEGVALYLPGVP